MACTLGDALHGDVLEALLADEAEQRSLQEPPCPPDPRVEPGSVDDNELRSVV
jgi:hypothetical protein